MWAFFSSPAPASCPFHVRLAPLLAHTSTDDQYQFGIRTFLAGLNAQQPDLKHTA